LKIFITILNYIDIGAPLIALLFFIKPFKRLSRELLYIFSFVCVQFIANTLATVLEQFRVPNYSVYVVNIILSFIILSLLFHRVIDTAIHKFIAVATVLFTVCAIISVSNGDGIDSYNSVLSAVASFLITFYCLVFFYRKLVSDTTRAGLTESSFFWIIIGVFTYYTGSFFIFISYKYLIAQESNVIGILWRFHNLLLAIFCTYTIYGLACKNYQKI
jgi:hypothetical protein